MKIYYINHLNQRIDFKGDIHVANTDLFDSLWSYESELNRIYNIQKPIKEAIIELHLLSDELNKHYDLMLEVFETDISMNKMGKIYVSNESNTIVYYMDCFIMDNTNSSWMYRKDYMYKTLKVVSPYGMWKQTHNSKFYITSSTFKTKQYAYSYPYQYQRNNGIDSINNTSYKDAYFIMTIYGPINNPSIAIGENSYIVNTNIADNEILVIDYSSESTREIIKKDLNNTYSINCFNDRNKTTPFFKKIKSGNSSVRWDGTFQFEIILFEERSQPK